MKTYKRETENEILRLVYEYGLTHELASELGGEYIYQDDNAQIDAIQLVSDIFDCIMESEER